MIRETQKVWIVPNPGGEPHPAFVIKLSKDGRHALVISGTGTKPAAGTPHEAVEPFRRMGKALRLSKATYFCAGAVHVRRVDELEVRPPEISCPTALWIRLRDLALEGSKEKLAREDFAEWWPDEAKAQIVEPSKTESDTND